MSCFRESNLSINVITSAIKFTNVTTLSYADIFKILATTNNRSVNYRYSERKHAIKFDESQFELDQNKRYPIEQVIKAIDCLAYQSCEMPKWQTCDAKKLLDDTREALLKKWYQTHFKHESFDNSYDLAEWGITESTPYNKPANYSSYAEIQGYTNKVINR